MEIKVLKDIMHSNKETAEEVKDYLRQNGIYMIDIISSPGSGKTALVDALLSKMKEKYGIAVIIGDISTSRDAERIIKHNVPVYQIETERFNRDCHLESSWIMTCLKSFDLSALDIVIIENIGNLVCPAEFELGEDEKITVLSVTEGEDKPVKYPQAFFAASCAVINKIDLLPHVEYDVKLVEEDIKKVSPGIKIIKTSALKGDGIDELADYITSGVERKKAGS